VSALAEDREGSPQRGRPRDANVENAILNAAVAILNEVGYNDLSIEAVASRARVGRPTVYRRWPSKLDLVVDAVVRLSPAVSTPDTGDVFTDLEELISGTIEDMTSSPVGRAILALAGTVATDRAELFDRFNEHYLVPRRAAFLTVLRRGIDAGRLRADIDPDLILDLMLGASTYRWLTTGHPIGRAATRPVVDLIWNLLAA
jgi:AcrR family transcriptional regulator